METIDIASIELPSMEKITSKSSFKSPELIKKESKVFVYESGFFGMKHNLSCHNEIIQPDHAIFEGLDEKLNIFKHQNKPKFI